jgi:hypothetical protein
MKKAVIPFIAFLLFIFFGAAEVLAQEQREARTITVRSSEVNNGVVVLAAREGQNSLELHCNKDMSGCTVLVPGTYLMVRLPKNRGVYDCANVDIYRTTTDPETGDKIGQYCLVEER